jgi:hypothetical protein
MIPTLRPHRPLPAPPLDLRFIDLFMALVLALVFLALLLMIVAGSVPPGQPAPPADPARLQVLEDRLRGAQAQIDRLTADNNRLRSTAEQVTPLRRQVEELQGQIDDARPRARTLEIQNRRLREQVEQITTSFQLPWWVTWLLLVNAAVGLLAVISSGLVRLQLARGAIVWQALRPAAWLLAVVVVAAVAGLALGPEEIGFALRVPWWALLLLGVGQLLGLRYAWLILKGRLMHYRVLRDGEDLRTYRVPLRMP